MNFRVGQRVVCVNDGAVRGIPYTGGPWDKGEEIRNGEVYTVTRVYVFAGHPSLWLKEVCRSKASRRWCGEDVGYLASRFRPLVEKKTDAGMAILKTILDEVNAGKHREIIDA